MFQLVLNSFNQVGNKKAHIKTLQLFLLPPPQILIFVREIILTEFKNLKSYN